MQRSEAQREASRKNGARSHGPKTPEGKRRSSQNARSHGFYSRYVCMPEEDRDLYNKLLQDHIESIQPRNGLEASYTESLAATAYQLRRAWAVQTQLIHNEFINCPESECKEPEYVLIATAEAMAKLWDTSRFRCLERYAARLSTINRRVLENLVIIRRHFQAEGPTSQNEPETALESTSNPAGNPKIEPADSNPASHPYPGLLNAQSPTANPQPLTPNPQPPNLPPPTPISHLPTPISQLPSSTVLTSGFKPGVIT